MARTKKLWRALRIVCVSNEIATKRKNKSTGGLKPKKGKRGDHLEKDGRERTLSNRNQKSGRPEKEVTPAEKEQLEMPAMQGWKREGVLSKVIKL